MKVASISTVFCVFNLNIFSTIMSKNKPKTTTCFRNRKVHLFTFSSAEEQ